LINAVAATVSQAEADHLAAHPLVQAVVPDLMIPVPRHSRTTNAAAPRNNSSIVEQWASASPSSAATDLCNTLEPQALQLTHTAFCDTSIPQAQEVLDGNGDRITGKGVRVASIADGLDTTVSGFARPDGTSVFFD
jgi:hypothetical protein